MDSPERLEKIVDYIIRYHNQKTHNREYTAMFAVSSIENLIKYYELFSKKKEAGGHDLPRNFLFFSFKTCESQQRITFPDYDKDPGDARIPDYRNCLFWTPNIPVGAGDTVSLDFFSSDLHGDYKVIVRGITDDGQVMHGECSFTVK